MTIDIEVTRKDDDELLKGSFKQPFPLVRIAPGTQVSWQVVNGSEHDSFILSFRDGSPFPGVTAISGGCQKRDYDDDDEPKSAPLLAKTEGDFHYEVFVTDGQTGEVFSIQNCPHIRVDGD